MAVNVSTMYKVRRIRVTLVKTQDDIVVFGEGQTFQFPSGCHELKLLKFECQKKRSTVPEPNIFGPKTVKTNGVKKTRCLL